jgi:aldose 1-epimerase
MPATTFGTMPDGTVIEELTIAAGALTAKVINLGAVIRDVRLAGVDHPLVLGFDRLEHYISHSPHFGAVAGRSANRIAGGNLSIDGRTWQLTRNENGRTHLHGGTNGFGKRPWRLADATADSVSLTITGLDGEEGYPGRVEALVRYTIEPPATIRMDAEAIADAPTIVNLAQHSYFNLDDSETILDHHVTIFADTCTPTDSDKIPTGEIVPVEGTDYDFRAPRPIRLMRDGRRVEYDLNYVVGMTRSQSPRPQARLHSPKSGLTLDVSSTEPGLQFYDGCMLYCPVPGLSGRDYSLNAGVCFEPQLFPDAPNHSNFQTSVLRPGETYRQLSRFTFSRG